MNRENSQARTLLRSRKWLACTSLILLLYTLIQPVFAQQYYYITHKPTGAAIHSCSAIDGTAVTGNLSYQNNECSQWQRIANNSTFFLQNRVTDKLIRPDTADNGSAISVRPNGWRGAWTQWTYVDRGESFGHLKNAATGKFIFLHGRDPNGVLEQQPSTWQGAYTQWKFDPVVIVTPTPTPTFVPEPDQVTLTETFITWQTFGFNMASDFSLLSFDHSNVSEQTYRAWILENNYLKVTLVPEFGGRILSMINKSTGREELYQNPVGTPYLVGSGIFYYDWLMIYGGIFPTFPEAEHGKSWNRAWDFDIVNENDESVSVVMSYQDNDAYSRAPSRYIRGATRLQAEYFVSLSANRAALDTEIKLTNPTNNSVRYEYWTNTTLAPGSDIGNSRATSGLEMIAPINSVFIDYGIGVSQWNDVKWFRNHTGEGIAYASPNMQGANFWGAINHDNEEGIFRIADNNLTPGLKIWTFGFDSVFIDPFSDGAQWHRPAIELWAGETNRFFQKKNFPANSSHSIMETYSPSVMLKNVTHANDKVLVDIANDGVHINFMEPNQQYRVRLVDDGDVAFDDVVTPDTSAGNHILGELSNRYQLDIFTMSGDEVFRVGN